MAIQLKCSSLFLSIRAALGETKFGASRYSIVHRGIIKVGHTGGSVKNRTLCTNLRIVLRTDLGAHEAKKDARKRSEKLLVA